MVIVFLNSKVDLSLNEKEQIIHYFEEILTKYEFEFQYFNSSNSRKILKILENKGKLWLKKLNKTNIQAFHHKYLKKHEALEIVINQITPTIKEILDEYLDGIPEEYVKDISKELKKKIHDKICEYKIFS